MHGMVVEWSLAQALAPGTQLGCLVIKDKRLDNSVLMGQSKWHTQNKTRMNILHWPANYLLFVLHACLGKNIMFPSGPVQVTALLTSGHITHRSVTTGKYSVIQLSCYFSQHRSQDMLLRAITGKFPESRPTVWEVYLLLLLLLLSLCPWPRHLTSGRSRGSVPIISTLWLKASKMTNIKQTKE